MSRALKKRRKRCAAIVEERMLKQDDQLFQTAFSKWEKIMGKLPSSQSYPNADQSRRLAGGADAVPAGSEETAPQTSSAGIEKSSDSPDIIIMETPASSTASDPLQESTGDKKVDEMIDYIIQHLQEAGKALASLSGNHEHDLKLIFVDLMAKMQNKIGNAESKLDSANNGLNELRKQLMSRIDELQQLRLKLTECQTKNALYEKAMADSGMKVTIGTDPSRSMVHLAPMAPGGGPSMSSSLHVPGLEASQMGGQPSARGMIPSELSSRLPPGSQLQPDGSVLLPSGEIVPISAVSSMEIPGSIYSAQRSGLTSGGSALRSGVLMGTSGAASAAGVAGVAGAASAAGVAGAASAAGVAGAASAPGVAGAVSAPGVSGAASAAGVAGASTGAIGPSTIPIEQLSGYDANYQIPVNGPCGQVDREIDRTKREVELEAEVDCLRREMERIIKESADYENAIHRALLKGVSSLNVEALKVLKNPPVGCCVPCLPCNPANENTTTIDIPSPKPMKDCWTSQHDKPIAPSRFDGFCRQKSEEKREMSRCSKKPAMSVCYSSANNKKTSQTSMVFLLPQQSPDNNNTCPAYPRLTARPNSGGSKSVCLDGKYRKTSSSRDRNFYPTRASRLGNQATCVGLTREYSRGFNCLDIFTAAARQDIQEYKRCEPCNRIRRIFND